MMLGQQLSTHEALSLTRGKSAFIAAPMSGFSSDSDYQESRKIILGMIKHLENDHKFSSVYYAGSEIASQAHFNSHELAMKRDLAALRKTDIFILLYPAKIISSVLVEAGYAMALLKPMLLMVKDKRDLPYFFQEAEQIPSEPNEIPKIAIQEYHDPQEIHSIIDSIMPKLLQYLLEIRR
jgi:nucleoside 2-deoxyribosyltransferase